MRGNPCKQICPKCKRQNFSMTLVSAVLGVPKTHPDDVLKCNSCGQTFKRYEVKIVK